MHKGGKMKASEIYANAARLKERDGLWKVGCCYSIAEIVKGAGDSCGTQFELSETMKSRYRPSSDRVWWMGECTPEMHEVRILALCFMAAIAADEERGNRRSNR